MEEKKIVLELTVEEFLFIKEKVCIPYRWGGYEWEQEIEKTVREKLETVYQKPVMSVKEYQERVKEAYEQGKQEWAGNYAAAAAQRELHFAFKIGEDKTDDNEGRRCET